MYLPSIVVVGFYFDKKRAKATGVSVCGAGIGTFVFAPLGTFLVENYGWKGANIIIGGICLHGIVFALTYRPLVVSNADYNEKSAQRDANTAVVRRSQKISPRRRPLPGGAGPPKFNQLETVTTFTYKPSLVRIDARNFDLS